MVLAASGARAHPGRARRDGRADGSGCTGDPAASAPACSGSARGSGDPAGRTGSRRTGDPGRARTGDPGSTGHAVALLRFRYRASPLTGRGAFLFGLSIRATEQRSRDTERDQRASDFGHDERRHVSERDPGE